MGKELLQFTKYTKLKKINETCYDREHYKVGRNEPTICESLFIMDTERTVGCSPCLRRAFSGRRLPEIARALGNNGPKCAAIHTLKRSAAY